MKWRCIKDIQYHGEWHRKGEVYEERFPIFKQFYEPVRKKGTRNRMKDPDEKR